MSFLHEDLIGGSVTFLLHCIRLSDTVNIRDAANAVATAVGAHAQREAQNVSSGATAVLCPQALLNALPQLFTYLINAHNLSNADSRQAEHAVTNLLLKMVLLSSSRQLTMKEALSRNLLFLLNAAFLQLRVLQQGAHRVTFSGVPSVTVIPTMSPFTSLFDDYIWLAIFALLQLGPEGFKAKLADLGKARNPMDNLFIHHILHMTLRCLGYYFARLCDAHGSFGLQTSNVIHLLQASRSAFPLDVLKVFNTNFKPTVREAKRNFSVPSELAPIVERVASTAAAAMSLIDSIDMLPALIESVESLRASMTWLCAVVSFCSGPRGADESHGGITRRTFDASMRVNEAALPILSQAATGWLQQQQQAQQPSVAKLLENLSHRMTVTSLVLVAAWSLHRSQALELIAAAPASSASDVVVVQSPEVLCENMLHLAKKLNASCGSVGPMRFASLIAQATEEVLQFASVAEESFLATDSAPAFDAMSKLFAQFEARASNSVGNSRNGATEMTELRIGRHLLASLAGAAVAQRGSDDSAHEAWWQLCGQFWKIFSSNAETPASAHAVSDSARASVEAQFSAATSDTRDFGVALSVLAPEWDNLESWISNRYSHRVQAAPHSCPPILNAAGQALNRTVACCLRGQGGLARAASYCKVFAQLMLMNDAVPVEMAVELLGSAGALLSAAVEKHYPGALNERLMVESLTAKVVAARLKVFPMCCPAAEEPV
jgi:hypothetical protein